jgi:hypothetical protein
VLNNLAHILMQVGDDKYIHAQILKTSIFIAWENGDSYCHIDNNSTIPCDQGLVPIYVAQVKSVVDVQTAVKFAEKHKISTRVKGASHDL